jgi:3-oxoadipate enol-lactonase
MPTTKLGTSTIWWNSTGSGSPILLINGLSSPSSVWFRLTPLLEKTHRVIVFDNLGTGRTDTPSEPWTIADMAEAGAKVLEAAGEAKAAVLGISLGGMIAEELTLNHPELVTHLILVSTHAGLHHVDGDPVVLAALNDSASMPPEERTDLLLSFTYAEATPKEKWLEDAAVRAEQPTSPEAYAGQLAAAGPWDRIDDLATITTPTFVLHGEEDRMVPIPAAQLLYDTIPGAKMTVMTGAGHQLFTDKPDEGAQAVLEFLDS